MWDELRDRVQVDRLQLVRLLDLHSALLTKCRTQEPTIDELPALAAILHSAYTGIENILKRIAVEMDGDYPSSPFWHSRLLDRMSDNGPKRPAVISRSLNQELQQYLDFRHVFRHAYTLELKWMKMAHLVHGLEDVMPRLQGELDQFLADIPVGEHDENPSEGGRLVVLGTNDGLHERLGALRSNLTGVIRGKDESVDVLIIALIAGGSVLLEDVPGVGKTTLAKALAKSIDASFNRIQFTPDLLPADILGASIFGPADGSFTFRAGPIFCNVLLADEINRASPRTQSALLEAMSEMQATIEGTRHALDAPFLVVATENPIEFHGTYPLPEAQLDRFLVLLTLGYPDPDTEVRILHEQAETHPIDAIRTVVSKAEVVEIQKQVRRVHMDQGISRYIVEIVAHTRSDPRVKLGASPRGSLMLFRAAQAAAFQAGRDYVLPDDVQRLAPYVLAHRIVLTPEAKYGGTLKRDVIEALVERVKVPT